MRDDKEIDTALRKPAAVSLEVSIDAEVELASYNTLALSAKAEFFCRAQTLQQLYAALDWARGKKLPVTLLGGGSNIVLAGNVAGLVIRVDIGGVQIAREGKDKIELHIGAGENWHCTVRDTLARGWYGLENLALIPGNVGAAPIQNIGAYGVELSDRFVSLTAVDTDTGDLLTLTNTDCRFGYRDSSFKGPLKNRVVIVGVTLSLTKTPQLCLEYPALAGAIDAMGKAATAEMVYEAVCSIRRSKLPDPSLLPNVGSFFKNPLVSNQLAENLRSQYPGIVCFPQPDGLEKLAAGWLLEHAGWKGYRRGYIGVHVDQALVLVNYGGGSGREILALADDIRTDIDNRFGVNLEIEPNVWGLGG